MHRFLLAALFSAATAHAVPVELTHSGRVLNPVGDPIEHATALTVSLYGEAAGGTAVWSSTYAEVDLQSGYYTVLLGGDASNPLESSLLDAGPLYLGIKVASDAELRPRPPLTSVPYARLAGAVHGDVQVGSRDEDCGLALAGSLRWTGSNLEVCTGSAWSGLVQGADGSGPSLAAESCISLHQSNPELTTGTYWIDADGAGGASPYEVTCDMETDGGGWVRILHSAPRYGDTQQASAAEASGVFSEVRAVHLSGYVACNCSYAANGAAHPWQACNPSHGDVWSWELIRNGDYIFAQSAWSSLPPGCAVPSTGTGDIVCAGSVTIDRSDALIPTWREPSHGVSTSDNCGTQLIDLWGR